MAKKIQTILAILLVITVATMAYGASYPFVEAIKDVFIGGIPHKLQLGHVFSPTAFKNLINAFVAGNSWRLLLSTGAKFAGIVGIAITLAELLNYLQSEGAVVQQTTGYYYEYPDGCIVEVTSNSSTSSQSWSGAKINLSPYCQSPWVEHSGTYKTNDNHSCVTITLKKNGQEVASIPDAYIKAGYTSVVVQKAGEDEKQPTAVGNVTVNEQALDNVLSNENKVAQVQQAINTGVANTAQVVSSVPANHVVVNPTIINAVPSTVTTSDGRTIDATTGQAVTVKMTVTESQNMDTVSVPSLPDVASMDTNIQIEQKKNIATLLTNFVTKHPLLTFLNNFKQNISVGGSCSFSVSFMGASSSIDFCQYESIYTYIGGVLVAFASIMSVIIMVKG